MRTQILFTVTAALGALLAAGCSSEARPLEHGADTGCETCHGAPPPAPHAQNASCASCHATTVAPDGTIVEGGDHMNGTVEAGGHEDGFAAPAVHGPAALPDMTACQSCHGTDYAGGTSGVSCNACHATAGFPDWRTSCTFCHGAPPAAPHTQSTNCAACHATTVAPDGTILEGGDHMNGAIDGAGGHASGFAAPTVHGPVALAGLASCRSCHGNDYAGGTSGTSCNACHTSAGYADWQANCTFCHGTQTPGWTSESLTLAAPNAGAHAKHLVGGSVGAAVACATCHAVPTTLTHVDGAAVPQFSGLANADAVTSTFVNGTCTTYCHGASLGTTTTPAWTGAALACDACHGLPPDSGYHSYHSAAPCASCHLGYDVASTTVDLTLHVNGANDVRFHPKAGGDDIVWTQGWTDCTSCHTVAASAP